MKSSAKNSIVIFSTAAIICISCFVNIPMNLPNNNLSLENIPFVIQNMFAVLSGIVLGFPQGAAGVGIFLLLGVFGLPVFSGGTSGISIISGSTGGFLVSYYLGAMISGVIAGKPNTQEKKITVKNILKLFISGLVGFLIIYIIGTIHFVKVTACSIVQGIQICVIPFLLYDGIKLIIIVFIATFLRPVVARFCYDPSIGK